MMKFKDLKQKAEDAGFSVNLMGETQISVDEPHYHWSTPHEWVYFTDVGGHAVPFLATSRKFETRVLNAIKYWG